jgi:hypothetical protein
VRARRKRRKSKEEGKSRENFEGRDDGKRRRARAAPFLIPSAHLRSHVLTRPFAPPARSPTAPTPGPQPAPVRPVAPANPAHDLSLKSSALDPLRGGGRSWLMRIEGEGGGRGEDGKGREDEG